MKTVKKKFYELEKKQKNISDKLDKYEFNFNNEQKKVNEINNIDDFTFKNKNNFESSAKIDKDYQKVLDKRLDEIMGKINDNIINQNYIDFYNFLLQGRPKYSKNKSKKNSSQISNGNDEYIKIEKKENGSNKNNNKLKNNFSKNNNNINNNIINKENDINNNNNINNNDKNNNSIIKNSINNINNQNNNENKDEEDDDEEKYNDFEKDDIDINNNNNINNLDNNINLNNKVNNENDINNNNINQNKINVDNNNIPIEKMNIHISYNGPGNINLEDMKNQQNLELIHKQQNIFLGNELTLLKVKLNKIRKDNEFLQSLIHEKGMVKNTNVLEKFIGGFVEKLSLNWKEIVEDIIDEVLIDEIHELNEIELKKTNYEKNKNKLINNLYIVGLGGIIPDKNEENTNVDLLLGNIELIKKILNSVNENEKNIKIKYNLK